MNSAGMRRLSQAPSGSPRRCASWKASLASVSAVLASLTAVSARACSCAAVPLRTLAASAVSRAACVGPLGGVEAEPGGLRGLVGRLRGTLGGLDGEARYACRLDRRGMVAFGCPPVREQFRRRALAQALAFGFGHR